MLKDNINISYDPQANQYDFSACAELTIEDWISLYNLQLDYPVINYDISTIEDAVIPHQEIVPPISNGSKSSKLPVVLVAVGGAALITTAVVVAKSRLKSKILRSAFK